MNVKTPAEVLAMTTEERRDYSNQLAKKVMTKFVIMTVVKVGLVVAVTVVANRIAANLPDED